MTLPDRKPWGRGSGVWIRPDHWSVTGPYLSVVSSSTPEAPHDLLPSAYKRNEPLSSFTPVFFMGSMTLHNASAMTASWVVPVSKNKTKTKKRTY